jgi:glycyl-tRNA synthetase
MQESSSSSSSEVAQERDYEARLVLDRTSLDGLLKRRFFIAPSFSIYGGTRGLYDYGPPGCAVKANLLEYWRQHFVLEEDMLELDTPCLTPEIVLQTSGHVAKFQDLMVKEEGTGNCFRADHLLEEHLEKLLEDKNLDANLRREYQQALARADDFSMEELAAVMEKYGVMSPDGKKVSAPFPFNLMFSTAIGPSGEGTLGYLRPETAQGIFVNFKRLLEYNGGKLPFAGAQIGSAYRNEIAPRSGVLRVREFQMAEIEHFVKPTEKDHPKFDAVRDLRINLFPRHQQTETNKLLHCTLGYAVSNGIIANQTLGYFIGRTYLFLVNCGVKPDKVRFRQHLSKEMAHYASDCWDAELLTSYGWIECVGIADRSCYDLSQHSGASNETLVAWESYDAPRLKEVLEAKPNKSAIGQALRGDAKLLYPYLESLSQEQLATLHSQLNAGEAKVTVAPNKAITLTPQLLTIERVQKKVAGETFTPHVIEPSFGIGRIVYSILEQSYWIRPGDEQRGVLSLAPQIAPVKCSVLPLLHKPELQKFVPALVSSLKAAGLSSKVDLTGQSIGRRYARTDEIGIPFAITIDYQTVDDGTVTLRERDTTEQIRVPLEKVAQLIRDLCDSKITWQALLASGAWEKAVGSVDTV